MVPCLLTFTLEEILKSGSRSSISNHMAISLCIASAVEDRTKSADRSSWLNSTVVHCNCSGVISMTSGGVASDENIAEVAVVGDTSMKGVTEVEMGQSSEVC